MEFMSLKSEEWLTDEKLSPKGVALRNEYARLCGFLSETTRPSHQTARAKYLIQSTFYWLAEQGYALPPHTLNLCVNNICNLKCRYCDFGQEQDDTFYYKYNVISKKKKIELPLETCKSIIDQSKWFSPIIRASFREPMLYSKIFDLIEYTKNSGLPFWLLTNGMTLDKDAKKLVDLNVDSVRISVDGPEKTHDEIRGRKGVYRKMIDGVKLLIEEKKKKKSDMQIGFYYTLNDLNSTECLSTLEALDREDVLRNVFFNFQWLNYTTEKMAEEHNLKHAEISGGRIEKSTVHGMNMMSFDIEKICHDAEKAKVLFPREKGYRIHFRPSFKKEDIVKFLSSDDFPIPDPRCKVLWYNMNINPVGEVKCFHHCLLPTVGNINKNTVMDIWNGQQLRKQRIDLQKYGAYRGCSRCWGLYSLLEDKARKGKD